MIPTGVSMVVSGGAVSPENRSNEEIRADLAYVRSFDKATLLNAPGASLRLLGDIEPLLARLAAVERERDGERAGRKKDYEWMLAKVKEQAAERDAAVAENARLLARIAAVEAPLAELLNECDLLRAEAFGYVANLIDKAVVALAASPTPTTEQDANE